MNKHIQLPILNNLEIFNPGPSKHEYPAHYHPQYCLSLVRSGFYIENKIMATQGAIVISLPFEIHSNALFDNASYHITTFYICPEIFHNFSDEIVANFDQKVINDSFHYAKFEEWQQKAYQCQQLSEFNILANDFLKILYGFWGKHGVSNHPRVVEDQLHLIEVIKSYIKAHIHSKITLVELCALTEFSKYQFIRWFKKSVGLTPFEYIVLQRVLHGKNLIALGLPISQVAHESGFYDQSHFSKYFKKYMGAAPGKFYNSRDCQP